MAGVDVRQAGGGADRRDHRQRERRLLEVLAGPDEVHHVERAEDPRRRGEAAIGAELLLELGLQVAAEQRLLADPDRVEQRGPVGLAGGEPAARDEKVWPSTLTLRTSKIEPWLDSEPRSNRYSRPSAAPSASGTPWCSADITAGLAARCAPALKVLGQDDPDLRRPMMV